MPPVALASVFTRDRIQNLAGIRALGRAELIGEDEIEALVEVDGRLTATVRGTLPYSVALWVEGTKKPGYSCTCPQGDDGKFCKHAAAVALTLHGGGRGAGRAAHAEQHEDDVEADPVFELLLGLEPRELAHLVYDAAQRDPRTVQRIEAKAAALVGRPAADVKHWRKAITAAFGRPSHFVDYYEAPTWAAGVDEVLAQLDGLLDDGEAEAVVLLTEYAFERADKATGYVDSSDGCFGSISWTIADLHLRACTAARPDPVALARRLVDLDLHGELDTFRRAAATYRDVLGSEGLAEYRRLVQPAHEALGPRGEHDFSTERFHLREAMLGVAHGVGDADEVVRICAQELLSPHDYEEIVDVLAAASRTDEAIEWARRGLAMPQREHQMRALRDRLATLLAGHGDEAAAIEVRRDGFRAAPSLGSYHALLDQTAAAGRPERAEQRAWARDWLRDRAAGDGGAIVGSVLVQILAYEGELDEAWAAATTFGCTDDWWMTLARAREREHPVDAIPVYEREVEALIDQKKSTAYAEAVKLMARIEALHATIGDGAWPTYLADVVSRHRQKRSLMAKIHDRGWS